MDPRRLLPYLLGVTVCAVLATGAAVVLQRPPTPPTPVAATPASARDTLAEWDQRRAEAWADGDVTALRALYVAGSRTGAADVRMLAAYVDRGLHVEGLTTQVLAWEVLEKSSSTLSVRVTDRIASGVAVGGSTRVPLPRDRATTRTVTLRRAAGDWRVVEVRAQASAAARTSRTSTSWKS